MHVDTSFFSSFLYLIPNISMHDPIYTRTKFLCSKNENKITKNDSYRRANGKKKIYILFRCKQNSVKLFYKSYANHSDTGFSAVYCSIYAQKFLVCELKSQLEHKHTHTHTNETFSVNRFYVRYHQNKVDPISCRFSAKSTDNAKAEHHLYH